VAGGQFGNFKSRAPGKRLGSYLEPLPPEKDCKINSQEMCPAWHLLSSHRQHHSN